MLLNDLPDIELVSARVHNTWMANKLRLGIYSRKSENGEELMTDYNNLSEKAKDLDRESVRTVYEAIKELNYVQIS